MMKTQRKSGVELMKLFGIFLIISCHVAQTLNNSKSSIFYMDLDAATGDWQKLFFALLYYSANFGNLIFFSSSAWFLLDSKNVKKKKMLQMIVDCWLISVVILLCAMGFGNQKISFNMILFSFAPTYFNNNWYVSCYLIFYAVHPLLNRLIDNINQQKHFKIIVSIFTLYYFLAFSAKLFMYYFGRGNNFQASSLFMWICVYFIIAYMKKYAISFVKNRRVNLLLVLVGVGGYYGLPILTNLIGLHMKAFEHAILIWKEDYNPFLLCAVIGLLNLATQAKLKSRTINYFASLSLFVYVMHENLLIRSLYRTAMWQAVYESYGSAQMFTWCIIFIVGIFVVAMLLSAIYFETFHKLVIRFCDWIYPKIATVYDKIEKRYVRRG